MKRAICVLIGVTLIAGPAQAAPAKSTAGASVSADAASASELSDRAIERFKAKDYDTAASLFEQAHALDPNPNYLFNIGRVYEEKGDIGRAVEFYQRFVKEPGVQIESRDLALQRLRVLKAILNETEAKPAESTEPADNTAAAEPVPTGKPSGDDPDPNKTMRLSGYGLLGIGGVAVIVGGVFGGLAVAKKSDLDDATTVEERQSLSHQGKTHALISDVTLFTGAGLVVTGLVLVLVARKRAKAARTAFTPSFGRGHVGVNWSLQF